MKILVCGGRDYKDEHTVNRILNLVHEKKGIFEIIHGAARGADTLAAKWAERNNIHCLDFPANWDKYGKRAGAIRNHRMLKEGAPDAVVAFPGGSGTKHMVKLAQKAGVPVWKLFD